MLTRAETKVLFGGANSISIASGAQNTSDTITLDATCIKASITIKADNSAAPAPGDTINVYILQSSGDPDGAAVADEFDSADTKHSYLLAVIDTSVTNPGVTTVSYPAVPQAGKLYADNNGAASMTYSAVIEELRSA